MCSSFLIMEMASKSQKDKSKFCESCDKRFAYNKRLVEHLDKTSGCKEFYISKEITLPVTKAQTKGQSSKDLSEENVNNQKDETMANLSCQSDDPSDIEDNEKVSVWKVYEESHENTSESGEKSKRKSYSLELKLDAIRRIDVGGVESMEVVALDLRLKLSLLKKWWENRDKLAKIKSLKDKKSELNSSAGKVQLQLGESLMDPDQTGSETTLEETSQSVGGSAAPGPGPGDSKSVEKKKRTKKVCGTCSGCEAEDCGECKHCQDKPKFGGKNTIKQRCLARLCLVQEEERKMARGTKGKVKRKSTSSMSGNVQEDADTQNVGIVDSSMELNDSSTEVEAAAVVDDTETPEKVGGDDMDELRTALGSIGADYSQSWPQEQPKHSPPSVPSVPVEGGQPLFPRMAAALELIPRPIQANHFPVVSTNHPSIAGPEAVVTIQRVEKKRKRRKEERPRPTEVHNIHNILGQLSPVTPPELPSQWAGWTPGLTAQQQQLLQQGQRQGEGGGGVPPPPPPQHQTPTLYNPVPAPVPQYEPVGGAPLGQPNIQQKFYSDEGWRSGSGYNTYQQQESYTYNTAGAQVYIPPPPPQFNQIQHQPQAAPNLELPMASQESRVDSVRITPGKLECLRLISCKIVKNEMSPAEAAVETGLSEEMIKTWVGSLEDILETNKMAVEKAKKYDVLLVNYNKMRRAVWNLGKEFLSSTDDDPVDLSL